MLLALVVLSVFELPSRVVVAPRVCVDVEPLPLVAAGVLIHAVVEPKVLFVCGLLALVVLEQLHRVASEPALLADVGLLVQPGVVSPNLVAVEPPGLVVSACFDVPTAAAVCSRRPQKDLQISL